MKFVTEAAHMPGNHAKHLCHMHTTAGEREREEREREEREERERGEREREERERREREREIWPGEGLEREREGVRERERSGFAGCFPLITRSLKSWPTYITGPAMAGPHTRPKADRREKTLMTMSHRTATVFGTSDAISTESSISCMF